MDTVIKMGRQLKDKILLVKFVKKMLRKMNYGNTSQATNCLTDFNDIFAKKTTLGQKYIGQICIEKLEEDELQQYIIGYKLFDRFQ